MSMYLEYENTLKQITNFKKLTNTMNHKNNNIFINCQTLYNTFFLISFGYISFDLLFIE